MWVGKYVDGRDVTYGEDAAQFAVGNTPVTVAQVLEYDAFEQIEWASSEMRAWARSLRPASAQPPVTESGGIVADTPAVSRPGWFTRLPMWAKVLFVLFYPVSIPYGVWAMWRTQKFNTAVRVALTTVAVLFFLTGIVRYSLSSSTQQAATGTSAQTVNFQTAKAESVSAPTTAEVEAQAKAQADAEAKAAADAKAQADAEAKAQAQAEADAKAEAKAEAAALDASTVTMDEYKAVKTGMGLKKVTSIVGWSGEQMSSTDIAGYRGESRSWQNDDGSNMMVIFMNGRVQSKAQFGLD